MSITKYESMLAETWKPESKGDSIEGEIFLLDSKRLKEDLVPYVELLNADGVPTQVLLGNYALHKVYSNSDVVEGGYLAIRYDGESATIKNAGNFAKLFSICYFKPGDWQRSEDGSVSGKPTPLNKPSARRAESLKEASQDAKLTSWYDHPNSDEPFDPETPESHPKTSKRAKNG